MKHSFNVESTTLCKDCNKPLKQNLVDNNKHATLCYCCYRVANGKIKRISKLGEIVVDYLKMQKKNRLKYKFRQ